MSDHQNRNGTGFRFRNRESLSDPMSESDSDIGLPDSTRYGKIRGVMRCCVFVSDPGTCHASRNWVGAGTMEIARADVSDMTACLAGQPTDAFPQEILLPIVAIMAVRRHQVDEYRYPEYGRSNDQIELHGRGTG